MAEHIQEPAQSLSRLVSSEGCLYALPEGYEGSIRSDPASLHGHIHMNLDLEKVRQLSRDPQTEHPTDPHPRNVVGL